MDSDGVCRLTAIDGVPDFNLEEEFAGADEFFVEPAGETSQQSSGNPRPLNRRQLTELIETASQTRT